MKRQYSYEDKKIAISLYEKLGHLTWVISELGYPSRTMLYNWIKEYRETGKICEDKTKKSKYTFEERKLAVEYYINNGRSIKKTVTALGYPGKTLLCEWLKEDLPKEHRKWHCRSDANMVKYSIEQKSEAVLRYYQGDTSTQIAKEYKVHPNTVRSWKKELLGKESNATMPAKTDLKEDNKKTIEHMLDEKHLLEKKIKELERDVYRLQLQKDILEKAGELLKKSKGIDIKLLSNRNKAVIIGALREKYRLKELLSELSISKSSYCYQQKCLKKPDKYLYVRKEIEEIFHENYCSYGYRRIHISLKSKGITLSEKVIRRIMKEDNLSVKIISTKKYDSYKGEISPEVPNFIERNFHAEYPNQKWLTDITEFHIPAGKIYLSPVIDCFDGSAVSWAIGTSPNADLVNSMLDDALSTLSSNEKPIIHSDRGCHYRWSGWIDRMHTAGLKRSMSKKGCSPDNAACEGFFGRLKNEMFYGRQWMGVSLDDFAERINEYIYWYNNKRIKQSLGWLSPMEYRKNFLTQNKGV